MKTKRRLPGKLMRIETVYEGNFLDIGEKVVFMLDEKAISKVRVFGIVINRQDGTTSNDTKFCYLTIDDGSETIQLRQWERIYTNDDGSTYNQLEVMEGIKEGDIVDVIGRVQEYNDEAYIIPTTLTATQDINWEIHRRAKLLELDLKTHDLLQEEVSPLADVEQEFITEPSGGTDQTPDTTPDVTEEELEDTVYSLLSDDPSENTIDKIVERSGLEKSKIEEIMNSLHMDSRVFTPRPGKYSKLE